MADSVYSEIILDYYKNPVNFGKIKGADVEAHGGNATCGDTVDLFIKFEGKIIKDIKFTGQGCAISRAGACVLTEIAKGKTVDEVLEFLPDEIFSPLGGVIQTRIKCSLLGLNVIKKALSSWKKNPKKKLIVKGISI